MKKLLFSSLILVAALSSCNTTNISEETLDSTLHATDTLRELAPIDSTSIESDTVNFNKESEDKDADNKKPGGTLQNHKEMPEHNAPNPGKIDSIKNSYPKKK